MIQQTCEALVAKLRADVLPQVVIVGKGDLHEVKQTPSLLLVGPTLVLDKPKRFLLSDVVVDEPTLTYSETHEPWYYHLDFDLVLNTGAGTELLSLVQAVTGFFRANVALDVAPDARFLLTEMIPLGGLVRPNLSNLRQASGRYRIETVPVYDGYQATGPVVVDREFSVGATGGGPGDVVTIPGGTP